MRTLRWLLYSFWSSCWPRDCILKVLYLISCLQFAIHPLDCLYNQTPGSTQLWLFCQPAFRLIPSLLWDFQFLVCVGVSLTSYSRHVWFKPSMFDTFPSTRWTFFFFLIYLFFIEGELLYRILLFSVKPQHESDIDIHMSPPFWNSLLSSSPSHPSRLIRSPCLSFGSLTANSRWLPILHMVM